MNLKNLIIRLTEVRVKIKNTDPKIIRQKIYWLLSPFIFLILYVLFFEFFIDKLVKEPYESTLHGLFLVLILLFSIFATHKIIGKRFWYLSVLSLIIWIPSLMWTTLFLACALFENCL